MGEEKKEMNPILLVSGDYNAFEDGWNQISGTYMISGNMPSKTFEKTIYIGAYDRKDGAYGRIMGDHFSDLRCNRHTNPPLQNYYNKNINNPDFLLIVYDIKIENISNPWEAEKILTNVYGLAKDKKTFNIVEGGQCHTQERKDKISKTLLKRNESNRLERQRAKEEAKEERKRIREERRLERKKQQKLKNKERYYANLEESRRKGREYYHNNKEKILEKQREYTKKYYRKNITKEKIKEKNDKQKDYRKEYRKRNREKIKAYMREYKKKWEPSKNQKLSAVKRPPRLFHTSKLSKPI